MQSARFSRSALRAPPLRCSLPAARTRSPPPGAAAGAAKGAADAKDQLKVAFVYVSPANEEGWSSQHDLGRKYIEKKFGDRIKVT